MKRCCILSILMLWFCVGSIPSDACTRVFWNTNGQAMVTARTTDLFVSEEPKMLVMPRGIKKTGLVDDNPLTWTSKYGSVVITAFNSPTATEGVNEGGLSAHLLYLHNTKYSARNAKTPGLSNLLWAQYFLDNYKTVQEAINDRENFQIVATQVYGRTWPIHLVLEDATGDSAIIEFINGKMVTYHGPEYTVLANEPSYSEQVENLKRYKLFGGSLPMPGDIDSLSRFVRASSYLKTLPKPSDYHQAIAEIFSVIRTVMVPFGAADTSGKVAVDTWPTRWASVIDDTNKVYYFNSTTAPNIVWIELKSFNFNEGSPVMELDLTNTSLGGEVSKLFKPKA